MIDEYERYVSTRDSGFGYTANDQDFKDLLKVNAIARLKEIAASNSSASAAYDVLFSSLIRE
jgi:hypothetical protein